MIIHNYVTFVENTLNELGMSNIWISQFSCGVNPKWFKEKVKRTLKDIFLQEWYSCVDNNNVYSNYRKFKWSFGPDAFYITLPSDCAISLLRFRTTNNALPVNRLRSENVPIHERICQKCWLGDIGDEYHYLFLCPYFSEKRKEFLPKYYIDKPSFEKYHCLMSSNKKTLLLKLKHFVTYVCHNLRH